MSAKTPRARRRGYDLTNLAGVLTRRYGMLPPLSGCPRLLTLAELAAFLRISRKTVSRLIHRELAPLRAAVNLGGGAGWRIQPWALATLLKLPDPRRCPVCRRAWHGSKTVPPAQKPPDLAGRADALVGEDGPTIAIARAEPKPKVAGNRRRGR